MLQNRNGVEIDFKKAKRMIMRIIIEEKNNAKTNAYSDSQMVARIQKVIEEEVKCL